MNYGRQSISKEDIESVLKVLKSDFLTTGPKVSEFEEKFAAYVGAKFAVAVSSGTAALHLAYRAAGIGEGDEIIMSPMTFAATANAALYCGAKPVFVDIDDNGLIDENKISDSIYDRSKAIVPVHFAGFPCNMEAIKKIADDEGLIVIEDACHALGARYKDSMIGDCKYSDMAVFSLHPVKNITTGEGGVITTNSRELYEKLKVLRNHGIVTDQNKFKNKSQGPWYHEIQELGYNYRLTDLQCALGISQLKRIEEFLEARKEIAQKYDEAFKNLDRIQVLTTSNDKSSANHLYIIKLKDPKNRLEMYNHLKKDGINCQVHYLPVYLHPIYEDMGYESGLCPKAEDFYARILSIPIYVDLDSKDQEKVIKKILKDFEGGIE